MLLIVRNPFDAIESLFNLYLTNSHNKSIKHNEYKTFSDEWNSLIQDEVKMWNEFYEYWFTFQARCPIYIIKYETLINPKHTKQELVNIFQFILNYKIINGSYLDITIDNYLSNRQLKYKQRRGTILHSLSNYTNEQINYTLNNCKEMIRKLEYEVLLEKVITEDKIENIKSEADYDTISEINKKYMINLNNDYLSLNQFELASLVSLEL